MCGVKTNPCFRYGSKTGEYLVIFEVTPMNNHLESSRRDLIVDIVVDGFILKNKQITLFL